ncbi:MAG: hypothetical protein A3H69_02190 [Candidatus Sungbacteria bacterium RIFCSPLOWO2_02_FULL_47_9]|uniref:Uncharacterized protein n=1 Tax=Candidatus Sungbacteria bacterium RIFCSPHIGHO2_01_FULL_47_32 TaxID=1802264 RepID=A0A1G2K476_9BACT|nr:MAG: hypothetical protein UX72_C0001G0014 [Parcubacteria group bacterium GW2011_GWA2_47_10]OGZ94239.1 MAG: hypothetical protein A2633_05505 [Candidatus Sungbacteria bacterium RIFCSPHIGHO2_01_FULL_47_32]OGZ99708.1 MAG: hypothetical protein A3D57_02295 [Candidatus Sungbacteria bacterium RIFCSPHIGHO2_02_FULL_46_12]OHA05880.1 MAG: hypothetical protein A3A28_02635 [Candidatus Sungbacteria bacterium RIFCSPLOWO2_01_FULL_47_32]OHA08620.1 MAG: hypothetical protein A3H69_02190 [Candidatus Sungbacteria
MKHIVLFFSFFLFLPLVTDGASASRQFPNYKEETWLAAEYACDAGKTSMTFYKGVDYAVEVIKTADSTTYYILITDDEKKPFYFFVQKPDSSDIKEVSSAEWLRNILKTAPGYYADVSSLYFRKNAGQSDCVRKR